MNLSNPSAFEKCQESGLPRVDTFDTNKDKQSSGNNVLFQDLEKQNKTKQKHDLNEGQLIYITLQWPVEDSRSTEDRRTEENLKKNTE